MMKQKRVIEERGKKADNSEVKERKGGKGRGDNREGGAGNERGEAG